MRASFIAKLCSIALCALTCLPLLAAIKEDVTAQTQAPRARRQGKITESIEPEKNLTAPEKPSLAEQPVGKSESTHIEELSTQAQTGKEQRTVEEFVQPPIRPETAVDDPASKVEVNFEDTDLSNVTSWISKLFNVSFISNDAVNPPAKGIGLIANNKLTFKSHIPLTKRQVWDLFVIFLDLSGLAVRSSSIRSNFYQVVSVANTAPDTIVKQPLPSYVNVDWRALPDNDMYIRYVYFLQNMRLQSIQEVLNDLKGKNSQYAPLPSLEAFMITDKSNNIRTLMQVVEELDGVALPEAMSVLTLKNADAEDVGQLYKSLTSGDQQERRIASFLGQRNVPTKKYFPENVKIIVEKRTNSLIILGDRKSIRKIEDFITSYVDTELKQPYSPLYVYDLQYTQAKDIAQILDEVVNNYSKDSVAREYGSVRRGEKYLQPMVFEPETQSNRLLVKGEKEDWLMVRRIIEQLDVPQPQVAIEVLVVNVTGNDNKELGIQIRNKSPDQINPHINWQASGLPLSSGLASPVVVPTGTNAGSIAANLITLAQGQDVGSTLVSIGTAATGGVWALFKMLQTFARTEVLSNPYLVTTNNYEALISLGETRRVVSSNVVSGDTTATSQVDKTAALTVRVKPQINREGIITLDIFFELSNFTSAATSSTAANTTEHKSKTIANIADGEVLAFGGFMQTEIDETIVKTPLLGDVPVLGWFFKNETKNKIVNNIMVFISPHVIEPRLEGGMSGYSQHKVKTAGETLCFGEQAIQKRDPIHKWFFKDNVEFEQDTIDSFIQEKEVAGEISAQELIADGDESNDTQSESVPAEAPSGETDEEAVLPQDADEQAYTDGEYGEEPSYTEELNYPNDSKYAYQPGHRPTNKRTLPLEQPGNANFRPNSVQRRSPPVGQPAKNATQVQRAQPPRNQAHAQNKQAPSRKQKKGSILKTFDSNQRGKPKGVLA